MSRRTFLTSYPMVCACGCRERKDAGQEVVYNDNGKLVLLEHAEENRDMEPFSEAERAAARRNMCQRCFMVHGGECL